MAQTSESILVVEDESSIASFVALYLKNAGYSVRTVAKGADALDRSRPTRRR
jgi:CheY-like chemotaxis protein